VTVTVAGADAVVRPMVDRATAMRLAATEYRRVTDELRELSARDWAAATCCPGWDVRLMTCHVLGMAEFAASPAEQARQALRARRAEGAQFIDRLTAVQVAKHAHRPTAELVARMAAAGPRAVRGRRGAPAVLRRVSLAQSADPAGTSPERWTYGYLTDVIGTRDTWMHRSDIAEATGRPMVLTADHDGLIVADVVREWAARHGQPCSLTLTGPAGGSWTWGQDGPGYQLDAVQFCRILSRRGEGEGLLATAVPF
jgi:uncharacterized protein (TIGR03083 family)